MMFRNIKVSYTLTKTIDFVCTKCSRFSTENDEDETPHGESFEKSGKVLVSWIYSQFEDGEQKAVTIKIKSG